jgi:hypothetical protein
MASTQPKTDTPQSQPLAVGVDTLLRNAAACPDPNAPRFVRGPLCTVQCDRCKANGNTHSCKFGTPDVPEILLQTEFAGVGLKKAVAYLIDTGNGNGNGFSCANCVGFPTTFHVTSLPLNDAVLPVYGPMRWTLETDAFGNCIRARWMSDPDELTEGPIIEVAQMSDPDELTEGPIIEVARMSDPDDQNRSKVLSIFEGILELNRLGCNRSEISPAHPHPLGFGGKGHVLAVCNCGFRNCWEATIAGESDETSFPVKVTEFSRPNEELEDSVTRYVVCDAQPCSRCMDPNGEFRCAASLANMHEQENEVAGLGYDPTKVESVFTKMKWLSFAVAHLSEGKLANIQRIAVGKEDQDDFFAVHRNYILGILSLPEVEIVPIPREIQEKMNFRSAAKAWIDGTGPAFLSFGSDAPWRVPTSGASASSGNKSEHED